MASNSFLRHAAVYGLGTILLQLGGVLLTPVYTHYLAPADFGGLELLRRVAEVAVLVTLFTAWRQAALAFHGRADDPAQRRTVAATVVVVLLAVALTGMALLALVADPLAAWLDLGDPALFRLAVLAAFLEATCAVLLVFPQARQESGRYVALTLGQLVLRVALVLVFVVGCGWGVWGIFLASALVSGLLAAVLATRELTAGGRPDWSQVPAMARFALPFLPSGLCYFVLNNGDRFFLKPYGGVEVVGTYALGYQVALAVGLVARAPLTQVWSARMYDAARRPDAPDIFGAFFTRLLGVYLAVGLAVSLFQDEIVALLGTARYADASLVVAPVVLAYFFQAAADLMEGGFYVRRRTVHKSWISPVSTLLMVALYALLIPRWGAVGAALATLGGFAFHAALTFLVSQRVFPVRYQWGRLAAMLGLAVAAWGAARLLPAGPWTVPARILLGAAWLVLLWTAGVVAPEEKQHLIGAVRGLWARLGPRGRRALSLEAR